MKKRLPGIIAFLVLALSYLMIRYPLFSFHGMKEYPMLLFLIGSVALVISGIGLAHKVVPVCIAVGYPLGFILGYLFQKDGPHETNNMWVIWGVVFLGSVAVGILCGLIGKARARKQLQDTV